MPNQVRRTTQAEYLAQRVFHAVHLTPTDGTGLDAHVIDDVRDLMRKLNPYRDLNAGEMMAIAVILASANDRRLRVPTGGPGIFDVGGEEITRPIFLRAV